MSPQGHDGEREQMSHFLGEATASIIERLDSIYARSHPGPWRMYKDGVHPCEVGGMGSGDDYAICGQCYGPRANDHALWITSSHNDWPFVRDVIAQLIARLAPPTSNGGDHG